MSLFLEKVLDDDVNKTKGNDLAIELLLSQYQASPNLLGYLKAYTDEMDLLYEHTDRVYLGRFLEYATGEQLSTLGRIVGTSREFTLDPSNFGFKEFAGSGSFGTVGDANVGDVFATISPTVIVLNDELMRRVVRAKALCNGAPNQSADFMYGVIITLLGRVPSTIELKPDESIPDRDFFGFFEDTGSGSFGTISSATVGEVFKSVSTSYLYIPLAPNKVILTLAEADVSAEEVNLIGAMKPYFMPSGYQLVTNLI